MAGVVTAIGPLGAVGWGSASGALGGFGGQGLLVLPPLSFPLPVPGGTLLLPRRRATAAALQHALVPQRRELLLDHVPHAEVVRGARRVLVGLLVPLNPIRAQPFAGPVWAGPDPPALAAEAVRIPFHPQPIIHCPQAVLAHVLTELEAPGHAAFAFGDCCCGSAAPTATHAVGAPHGGGAAATSYPPHPNSPSFLSMEWSWGGC